MSEVDIFGTGEKVLVRSNGTIDGDISGGGDFVKVSGKENLKARIALRLLIRRGELESDPNIGSDLYKMKGLPFTTVTKEWMKILIYDSLIRDPLISEIENLDVIEDKSIKGQVRIIGNIKSVTDFKQINEEPHDYANGTSLYTLNKDFIRSVGEVKGFRNQNLVFFTQNVDYQLVGNDIEFISDMIPNDGSTFLVTYTFYDVDTSKEQSVPLTFPFNLG